LVPATYILGGSQVIPMHAEDSFTQSTKNGKIIEEESMWPLITGFSSYDFWPHPIKSSNPNQSLLKAVPPIMQ